MGKLRKYLQVNSRLGRTILAEFIGTFILVTFAVGSGMQYVLSKGELSSFLTVNIAGGLGLTFGIYWAGGVSGGSLNPAVTLVLCLQGAVKWRLFPCYTLANLAGAFAAAAVQYGVYYDALNSYDGGQRSTYGEKQTASIFATFPKSEISTLNCFFDQVFGTFILCGCILAVTDKRNMMPHKGLLPLVAGAIVVGIGTCWAYNCGYAINPARDLGPRIFTAIAGWGVEPFSYRNYNWFWVPIVGPLVGGLVSWIVYNFFVQLHWPASKDEILATTNSVTITVDGKLEMAANRTRSLYREHSLTESARRLSI